MLGFNWVTLRQTQEAIQTGRLEEAQRLLPGIAGHRRFQELQNQLVRALVERGQRSLKHEDSETAWNDLLKAEQVGGQECTPIALRQALARLGVTQVRALLEAGEERRGLEAISHLRDRAVRLPELDRLEETAREWVRARDLADHGEFAQALPLVARLRHLLPDSLNSLERFHQVLQEREKACFSGLVPLHEAAQGARWRDVLQLADQVLIQAPLHAEARRLRSQAWKTIEPATLVHTLVQTEPLPRPLPTDGPSNFYLLWIDGVGGYLVCLGNRITMGQATPDAHVDIPIFADVSRHHATLTRDTEGYLLEAIRPVQVNGQKVEKALLQSGDRLTLGTSCQFLFRQPVPVSASARLELVSGHRLLLAVDAILLMADTLVLGPGAQVHVAMPDLKQPVILYRNKEGLGIRYAGNLTIAGQPFKERGLVVPGATITGEDFSLTVESVNCS